MYKQVERVLLAALLATGLVSCSGKPAALPLSSLQSQDGSISYLVADFVNNPRETELVARDVVEISADGKNRRVLAHLPEDVADPSWSADRKSIVFAQQSGETSSLHVVDADGKNDRVILSQRGPLGAPVFSPEGKQIAYHSWKPGANAWSLYLIDIDGKNSRLLGDDITHTQTYPCWSPDGKHIAFHTELDNDNWDIGIVGTDSNKMQLLTHGTEKDWLPAYSPDGSKIAYWSTSTGKWELYVMNVDGGSRQQVTHEEGRTGVDISSPTWSPDGKYLAFASCRTKPGKAELQVVDLNGRELQLSDEERTVCAPA